MDLRQIRYLVAIADSGSFSAGAKRAFVTQPTLSAAIAEVEAEMGVRLFERHARGVRLTPAGRRALEHSRAVLREIEAMKGAGRQVAPAKPLRLGLLPTLPPQLVVTMLAQLRELEPARQWQTEDAPFDLLRQRLAAGRYDAIFTHLGRAMRGHRQVLFAEDAQALAVPRATRRGGPITPRFLHRLPLIVRVHCEQLQAASRVLDAWQVRPLVVARTESDERALAMVAAGIGACLMPDSFRHDGVVFLRSRSVRLSRRLGLEWIRDAAGGLLDALAPRF